MSVFVTRSAHPHLWMLFASVDVSMGNPVAYDAEYEVIDADADDVAAYELGFSAWSTSDVAIIAGLVEDDARFDELVATEVGGFINHQFAMA